jgi:hypothetical protein
MRARSLWEKGLTVLVGNGKVSMVNPIVGKTIGQKK